MTPHLSDEQIRLYRAKSLAPADLLRASNHLVACERCRALVASPGEVRSTVRAIQSVLGAEGGSLHLSYEEVAGYVDGQMSSDEAARVELHARECASCGSDLAEIGALRNQITQRPAPRPFWHRISEPWGNWLRWPGAIALAGAACALAVLLAIRFESRRDDLQARIEKTKPESPAAPGTQPAGGPQIRDGGRVLTAAADGRFTGLETLPEADRQAVERAWTAGQVDSGTSLAGLSAKGGVLLGSPNEAPAVKLIEPLATVVESQTPVFRWEPAAGAEYQVSIYDGSYNLVASSNWLQAAEWRASSALRRGALYSWQLRMRRNGNEVLVPTPPAPQARFQVLGAPEESEIARLKQSWGDSHLVMGVLLARAGMLDEAEQELAKLQQQNPGSPEIAKLLAGVEALRSGAKR